MRTLIAIPVYNEAKHLRAVIERVLEHAGNVLVVDDGSTDDSASLLATMPVDVIRHCVNRGYGRSLIDAFRFAGSEKYDWVITMDSDEQHEPERLPEFFDAIEKNDADIISGSRYLKAPTEAALALAPGDRRRINGLITEEINSLLSHRLGTKLTDSFCGFKAHRVSATNRLDLSEDGYAFPMQLWARAAAHGLRVREIPVDLIYNDPNRTFGAILNDPEARLRHYRDVLHHEIAMSGERVFVGHAGAANGACREAGLAEPAGRRARKVSNRADCPDRP
ncbi:MAG: glycosyltransferase family 2 protein [Phycisphaerales bacterium]